MKYYSTNRNAAAVNFKEATIKGQAPDKGLYFPEKIPMLDEAFFANLQQMSNEDIAFEVIKPFVADCIPEPDLKSIVAETVNFAIPLVRINEHISSLELFHGPTLAFKDIGARFMSRCLAYFVKEEIRKVTVLVATSGDTGGAVAHGFYDVPNVEVVILYPSGKVSSVQEKQLTTLGKNIHALEVKGSFDDCQRMVKTVFAHTDDFPNLYLTSANSINVARWLPQQFYYFYAYKQWPDHDNPPVISVPSGNFGNICAGLLAQASGLPVKHFIAACNANDTIPRFLQTQNYEPHAPVATISNAMDVAEPSNFVRILEIFKQQPGDLNEKLTAVSINDETTKQVLKTVFDKYGYLLDTHGAVGFAALQDYIKQHAQQQGIVVETAHPVKFYDVVEPVIETTIAVPAEIEKQLSLEKKSIIIENDAGTLKDFLLAIA